MVSDPIRPSVSVIIPAFNEADFIGPCLNSLMNQTVKPDEVIVVDNNCTDATVEIAGRFPVKIVRQERQGLVYARNAGMDEAAGDIIARCDADSTLDPNWIKVIKENFAASDESFCALTGRVYFNLPVIGKLMGRAYFVVRSWFYPHRGEWMSFTLAGPSMAMTRATWHKIRAEVCSDKTAVLEDFDLAIHVKRYGRIRFDRRLIAITSARRLINLKSFFIEYPLRKFKTIKLHSYLTKELSK